MSRVITDVELECWRGENVVMGNKSVMIVVRVEFERRYVGILVMKVVWKESK